MNKLFCFFFIYSASLLSQVSVVKGPFLQTGTPGSIIIKWQTNVATTTRASYGTSPAALNLSYTNAGTDTIHEAFLSGLSPYTKYFYAIGNASLTIQGDTNNYFITSPPQGSSGKFRFWVTGDCGNGSANQLNVKNKYLQYNGNRHTDGWLLLGDNAYSNGLDSEYTVNFFNVYQNDIMKKTVLWPAPGNHDYANSLVFQNSHAIAYYNLFHLPAGGEAGGVWSGTEAFYSYNYGNIHFISLDSYGFEMSLFRLYDTLGPQITWLKQDLASNVLPWVVAYWHHPPYTMASHNSDTEGELDSIRKNTIRILERYNVDFVLCGHSHAYERSKLMSGHYGYENSFNAAIHHISNSSALYNGSANSCPYIKNSGKKGTVYIVSGSAGSLGGQQSSFPHSAMYYSNATEGGSLIMDFNENRADIRWLCADGIIRDNFTVLKNAGTVNTYSVASGQSVTLHASWPGSYVWSNSSDTLRSHTVVPVKDTVFWVKDLFGCVTDTFKIVTYTGVPDINNQESKFGVYPNPSEDNFSLAFDVRENLPVSLFIVAENGKELCVFKNKKYTKGKHLFVLQTSDYHLSEGVYTINLRANGNLYYQKIVLIK